MLADIGMGRSAISSFVLIDVVSPSFVNFDPFTEINIYIYIFR